MVKRSWRRGGGKMTNRQWLQNLTDEELLKYLNIPCLEIRNSKCPEGLTCKNCQIKWLNDEHKEDDND